MRSKLCLKPDPADLVVHPALRTYFAYAFHKAALRLRSEINAALEKHDVVAPQLGLLRLLALDGPASQVDLGRGMGIDKATMVKFLDSLERRGCVKRVGDRRDRRIKRVAITAAGRRFLARATRARERVERKFLAPLRAREEKELRRIVAKLLP